MHIFYTYIYSFLTFKNQLIHNRQSAKKKVEYITIVTNNLLNFKNKYPSLLKKQEHAMLIS